LVNKQSVWIGISIILNLSIVLAACNLLSQPTASSGVSTPSVNREPVINSPTSTLPAEKPTDTPEATPPQQEYTNLNFGFSLYYPNSYEVQENYIHAIAFLAPQGTQGHRERAFLNVELANDQTAEWYANQMKEENANLGIVITSSATSIAGQPAYILDHVPGQDLSRQVFIVYKGFLYRLTFFPDDSQAGEDYQQMETLYAVMINTLRFLPDRREVPPILTVSNMIYQIKRALEARSIDDVARLLSEEFFVWYWDPKTPEDVNYESYGRNEAAQVMIDQYLSQAPKLVFLQAVDWKSMVGNSEPFTAFFPNENIKAVLVQGWGLQGKDEAAIIIAQRSDGSLVWRGVFMTQGTFAR